MSIEDKADWELAMSDIVERLLELAVVECELACECDCPPEATANYRYAKTCEQAADEITRLRAEVERLNKSRNKWGQKYNKLLEKHKVTLSQLKVAVWSDSEECKFLTAENERLRAALEQIAKYSADKDEMDWEDTVLEMNAIARAALGDTHE